MMRLNIPLSEDGMVTFNATLFAIVRQSLTIELQGKVSVFTLIVNYNGLITNTDIID